MTAVFALENHVAGGSFDSPFDRAVAMELGSAPFEPLDEWTSRRLRAQERKRQHYERMAKDPDDHVPEMIYAPLSLEVPDSMAREYLKLQGLWTDQFEKAVSGRTYPQDPLLTGWTPLDDYIEEENRHRRIDFRFPSAGSTEEAEFEIRIVFGARIPYAALIDGEGDPSPETEWISWSRAATEVEGWDRYVIEYGRPDAEPEHFEFPVPTHARTPGPLTLGAARRFAETYLRKRF